VGRRRRDADRLHPPGADEREPGGDRSFVPLDHPEVWLKQGDPAIYFSP
jgi:alpha-amylase